MSSPSRPPVATGVAGRDTAHDGRRRPRHRRRHRDARRSAAGAAGAARSGCLRLPVVMDHRRRRHVRRDRPRPLGALRAQPASTSCDRRRRRDLAAAASDAVLVGGRAPSPSSSRPTASGPPWPGPWSPEHPVAFMCAEFGVHASLPVYSGGLGVLAGDIVKEASDLALPMVGRRPPLPHRLLPPADRHQRHAARVLDRRRSRPSSPCVPVTDAVDWRRGSR